MCPERDALITGCRGSVADYLSKILDERNSLQGSHQHLDMSITPADRRRGRQKQSCHASSPTTCRLRVHAPRSSLLLRLRGAVMPSDAASSQICHNLAKSLDCWPCQGSRCGPQAPLSLFLAQLGQTINISVSSLYLTRSMDSWTLMVQYFEVDGKVSREVSWLLLGIKT